MKHIPIRLGPLALRLTVISICMATLGILSFTTARADLSLAEKYASTVQERYMLEKAGQDFLRQAGNALAEGSGLEGLAGTETGEDGILYKTLEYEEVRLLIGLLREGDHGFRVVEWRIQKDWEPEDNLGDLWDGVF